MPHGIPKIGAFAYEKEKAARERAQAEAAAAPQPEVLGVVAPEHTTPGPQGVATSWTGPSGNVDLDEPPPPWELEDVEFAASDARRYVSVPENWVLRWVNPKLIEQTGWNFWRPVMTSDPKVTCKVQQMEGPDGNIRRGGMTGDILAWAYKGWVESNRKRLQARTDQQTQSAVDKQEQLFDEFRRGKYGPHINLETAKHPTHTMGDGRSMRD